MPNFFHQLIADAVNSHSQKTALEQKNNTLTYQQLSTLSHQAAQGLIGLSIQPGDRIAIYLPKQFEAIITFIAASMIGSIFVPINPLLKPAQVKHILQDCNARVLITSQSRVGQLTDVLSGCCDLESIILTDASDNQASPATLKQQLTTWQYITHDHTPITPIEEDKNGLAAILYTSGSTGLPKGVMLSHNNLVIGAQSVAEYLANSAEDRILALLPLSFDYGLSQITTAFTVGATTVLMDYLLPRDIIKTVASKQITGLAAVPPVWNQIANLDWPDEAKQSLRYLTNSGGALNRSTIYSLREQLPNSELYLMYGLTEAFRSSYLPPVLLEKHPDAIGQAIPNVELRVLREDGTPCRVDEPGELVHRGPLVSLGYWNNPEATAERFRPVPVCFENAHTDERVVWSGDTVKMDQEGLLYFIERRDEMIKTSSYRVSPTEIESVIQNSGLVSQVAALGIPHPMLGKAIVVVASPYEASPTMEQQLLTLCQQQLANFMVPLKFIIQDSLPTNPNGKLDRKQLAHTYQAIFQD